MNNCISESKPLAFIWFSVALIISALSVYFAINDLLMLVPSFLGMAVIHVYIGRQRLTKYQISDAQYKKVIQTLGIFVVIASGSPAGFYQLSAA